jgi:hypothetical protein
MPEATKRPFGCPLVPTRSRDLIQTQLAATGRDDASGASGARRALTGQVRSIGDLKKAAGKQFVACGRPQERSESLLDNRDAPAAEAARQLLWGAARDKLACRSRRGAHGKGGERRTRFLAAHFSHGNEI